jgi:phosphoenolpyruvate---glycerone phosphotransferase subunit DhaL
VNGTELRGILVPALIRLAGSRDELRDLDAAIGDGDLGITVSEGSFAARDALVSLPEDATPGAVLRAMAPAIARANPSTFAALVSAALLASSRALGDGDTATPSQLIEAARVGAETIAARGKSQRGDKTILDALVPSLDAAERSDAPFDAAITAARDGVEATREMVSARGRAAWIGERTRGHVDPGATAYLRLLEAIEATRDEARGNAT